MKFDQEEEEFEFKPLTQGLGFHPRKDDVKENYKETTGSPKTASKKSLGLSASTSAAMTTATSPSVSAPSKAVSSSLKTTFLESPLPRPTTPSTPAPSDSGKAVESILKSLNEKNKGLQFQDKGKTISPYLQVAPGLAAGFLDLLLITSLGLVYMMSLIFTLKIDLIKTLSDGGMGVWLATAAVFIGVGFVYYTAQRIFMGFTLGDWAYEQRLGLPEEMEKTGYSLKVLARQLLIIATGIITLPLISWALGRDLAGVSGLCIYRKR